MAYKHLQFVWWGPRLQRLRNNDTVIYQFVWGVWDTSFVRFSSSDPIYCWALNLVFLEIRRWAPPIRERREERWLIR